MSGYPPLGGAGGSGGTSSTVSSIAEDMFFLSTSARDIFTNGHPDRLVQGVACAVGTGSQYEYFQWDAANGIWRDANLIYQGQKGQKGQKDQKINKSGRISTQAKRCIIGKLGEEVLLPPSGLLHQEYLKLINIPVNTIFNSDTCHAFSYK